MVFTKPNVNFLKSPTVSIMLRCQLCSTPLNIADNEELFVEAPLQALFVEAPLQELFEKHLCNQNSFVHSVFISSNVFSLILETVS